MDKAKNIRWIKWKNPVERWLWQNVIIGERPIFCAHYIYIFGMCVANIGTCTTNHIHMRWNVHDQKLIFFWHTQFWPTFLWYKMMVAILWRDVLCGNGGRILSDLFGFLLLDPLVGGLEVVGHLRVDRLVNLLLCTAHHFGRRIEAFLDEIICLEYSFGIIISQNLFKNMK